jgi:hypothetical protein
MGSFSKLCHTATENLGVVAGTPLQNVPFDHVKRTSS